MLEPDERKLSSPVLGGLGASNGARPLDPNPVMEEWPVIQGAIPRHDETLKSNVAFGHPATSRRR